MESTIESLDDNKVKLSVDVGEEEIEEAVDRAWRAIAKEVRVPGFRQGKAPRKVLEARLDPGLARSEALRDAVPDYYMRALHDHEVDAIAAPEIDITEGEESGPVSFAAVVEVRPEIDVPGYDSIEVVIPSAEPDQDAVDEQIDRLRSQSAELETATRPAMVGDHVTIDIQGTQEGESLDGLTADDYMYEVGATSILPEIDEQLTGAKVGDILVFEAEHPEEDEEPIDFRILVKEVKEKVLPDLDDEWAAEASEFATVDELRDDLLTRLSKIRLAGTQMAVREKTGESLADRVDDDDVPEALIQGEMQNRLHEMSHRLGSQGIDLEQYLIATGSTPEQFQEDLRKASLQAAKVDLALRAVARVEGLEVVDADIEEEIVQAASHLGRDVAELREEFEHTEGIQAIRSDIRKRKALDWLLERVRIVDEDDNPVAYEDLVVEEHDHEEPPSGDATADESAEPSSAGETAETDEQHEEDDQA